MLRSVWSRFRLRRQARRILRTLFDEPSILKGTSLRPAHGRRVDLVDYETAEDELTRFWFTILRHPRPHPYSSQHHEVMELYRYDLRDQKITREKSLNLSRVKGRDGEPAGRGGF